MWRGVICLNHVLLTNELFVNKKNGLSVHPDIKSYIDTNPLLLSSCRQVLEKPVFTQRPAIILLRSIAGLRIMCAPVIFSNLDISKMNQTRLENTFWENMHNALSIYT